MCSVWICDQTAKLTGFYNRDVDCLLRGTSWEYSHIQMEIPSSKDPQSVTLLR